MMVEIYTPEGKQQMSLSKVGGVYCVFSEHFGFIKIGCSIDFGQRLRAIQEGFPEPLQLVAIVTTSECQKAERWFHERLNSHRKMYEWFNTSASEIRSLFPLLKAICPDAEWIRFVRPHFLTPEVDYAMDALSMSVRPIVKKYGGLRNVAKLTAGQFLRNSGVGRMKMAEVATAMARHRIPWGGHQ